MSHISEPTSINSNKNYRIKDNVFQFSNTFNQPLDNFVIPDGIIMVSFGNTFDQPVDSVTFPDSCKEISFGYYFNQSIDNVVFPKFIEIIIFGENFNKSVDKCIFPESLTTIGFYNKDFHMHIDNTKFIKSIKQLILNVNHHSIPQIILDNDNIGLIHILNNPNATAAVNNILLLKQRMKRVELENIELSHKLTILMTDMSELKRYCYRF
jgi:hypothetical protein